MISTAIKRRKAEVAWIRGEVHAMTTLNKTAAEAVINGGFAVHAMPDVTGFGLIGHLREVARGWGVSVRLFAGKVPLLEGALECVQRGYVPAGLKANRGFAEGCVEYADDVPEDVRTLLYDPQTAGRLLISVAGGEAPRMVNSLHEQGTFAVIIAEVLDKGSPLIRVHARAPEIRCPQA